MDQLLKQLPFLLVVGAIPASIILITFGREISRIIRQWLDDRHDRKLREQAHRHRMEKLQARHEHELRLAAQLEEPVKLLALDPQFGKDFDRRLRVALSIEEEPAEEDEEISAARAVPRTSRRA